MKITVEKKELLKKLDMLAPIAKEATSVIPALSCVFIQKSELNSISLVCDNHTCRVKTVMETKEMDEGEETPKFDGFVIPAKPFQSFVKKVSGDSIVIEGMENNNIRVKSGRSSIELQGVAPSDFTAPAENVVVNAEITFPSKELSTSLKKVAYATADDATRPVLQGVLCSFGKDKVVFVGTDGKRMSVVEQEYTGESQSDTVILPETTEFLMKNLTDGDAKISISEKSMSVTCKDFEFYSTIIVQQYPNYSSFAKPDYKTTISIDRKSLLQSMELISIVFENVKFNKVDVTFKENQMFITGREVMAKNSTSSDIIDCDYAGDEINIHFNGTFLQDILKCLDEEKIKFGYNEAMAPFSILADKFIGVIMPVREA